MANDRGHILDLIAMWLTFHGTTTQTLERLQEEGTNKVRLQTTCGSTLHLLTDLTHTDNVNDLTGEGMLLQQLLQMSMIESLIYNTMESQTCFWTIAIANGFHHQVAQRTIIE